MFERQSLWKPSGGESRIVQTKKVRLGEEKDFLRFPLVKLAPGLEATGEPESPSNLVGASG